MQVTQSERNRRDERALGLDIFSLLVGTVLCVSVAEIQHGLTKTNLEKERVDSIL